MFIKNPSGSNLSAYLGDMRMVGPLLKPKVDLKEPRVWQHNKFGKHTGSHISRPASGQDSFSLDSSRTTFFSAGHLLISYSYSLDTCWTIFFEEGEEAPNGEGYCLAQGTNKETQKNP